MKYSSKQKLATAMAATMAVSMVPAMAFAAPADVQAVLVKLAEEDVPATNNLDLTSAKKVVAEAQGLVKGDKNAQAIVDAYQASIDIFAAKDVTEWLDLRMKFFLAVDKIQGLDLSGSFKSDNTNNNHMKVKDKLAGTSTPAEVNAVVTALKGLPEASVIVDQASADANRAAVMAADAAFNALSEANKAMVAQDLKDKLAALKVELAKFPAVMENIDGTLKKEALGNTVVVTLPVEDAVSEVTLNGKELKAEDFDYSQTGKELKVALGAGLETGDITFKQGAKSYKVVIK